MDLKILNKEEALEIIKKCERPENIGLYKNKKDFNMIYPKTMYLMAWYHSHKNLNNSVKKINKLKEILGDYSFYLKKYKDISFTVKNAVWVFCINDEYFALYYSTEGMTIELTPNAKKDYEAFLDYLIFNICIEDNMPDYAKNILNNN